MDSLFLATIRKPLLALRVFDFCVSSVKKYRLGTSKCHDHDIFTLHQPIRVQHFEQGNENEPSSTTTIGFSIHAHDNTVPNVNLLYFSIASLAIGAIAVIRWLYRCKHIKHSAKSKFQIEITNGKECVHLDVLTLSMCPNNWILLGTDYVDSFIIRGKVLVSLHLDWHDLIMKNKLTDQIISLPTKIRVNPVLGMKLKRILKTPFNAYLLFNHANMAHNAPVTRPYICQRRPTPTYGDTSDK